MEMPPSDSAGHLAYVLALKILDALVERGTLDRGAARIILDDALEEFRRDTRTFASSARTHLSREIQKRQNAK